MPEQTEQVLVVLEWEDNSEETARKTNAAVNTISNTLNSLSNIMTRVMSANIMIQQSNLTLTRSYWALADAKRENARWSRQQYQLDIQMAQLQVRMAQRQLLITQRTGRMLDVEMARLQVQMASRDVTRSQWQEEDKRRQVDRNLFMAQQQLLIIEQQRRLMLVQLGVQTGLMVAQLTTLIAIKWADTTASMAQIAASTAGIAVPAVIAGVAAAVAAGAAMQQTNAPPAQTGRGELREVMRPGVARLHQGEVVMQKDEVYNQQRYESRSETTINISVPSATYAQQLADVLTERRLLQQSAIVHGTPPR